MQPSPSSPSLDRLSHLVPPPPPSHERLEQAWFDAPPPSVRRSSAPPPPPQPIGEFLGDPLADAWLR